MCRKLKPCTTQISQTMTFSICFLVLSLGGSTRNLCHKSSNHRQNNTFCNIDDHPSIHKICIFFCEQIPLFQLLDCEQTPMNKTTTLCVPVGQTTLHHHTSTPLTHTNTRQTNINLTHTNTSHQTHHTNQPHDKPMGTPWTPMGHPPMEPCEPHGNPM